LADFVTYLLDFYRVFLVISICFLALSTTDQDTFRLTEKFFRLIGGSDLFRFPVFLVILSYLINKKINFFLDKAIIPLYSRPRGVKWLIVEGIQGV